jgi:general secretion pathway protein G
MLLMTNRQKALHRSGFTLMEVLVVVAILVILAGVAIIAVPKYIDDARKSRAHLAAQSLSQACEAYHINPANSDGTYPNSLQDLLTPPFGGSSYLKNGQQDLVTPWNQQFALEQKTKSDNTVYMLVWTTAPDGTKISNFGIGPKAEPTF